MTTGRKYFSGNTLEIAVMQAARHHELQPEEVAYRKIEKRHGFLKARKSVVIEVDPDTPRISVAETVAPAEEPAQEVAAEAPTEVVAQAAETEEETESEATSAVIDEEEAPGESAVEPSKESETAPERDEWLVAPATEGQEPEEEASIEDLMAAAQRGLKDITAFAKLDLDVEVTQGEDQLEIELSGTDRDRLIEDRGNLLLAIQHLLPRLIRGYTGRSIPCHVDSEEFHAGREVELRKLAEDAAQEVRDQQRPRTLPPMNPAERRIIHVALADIKEIATESQGKGFFKRVTISPALRRPRGFDRY